MSAEKTINKPIPITFNVRRLDVISLSFSEEAHSLLYSTDLPNIDFNVVPDVKIDSNNKIVAVFLIIGASYKKNDEKIELGKIVTATEFIVQNLDDFLIEENGKRILSIPQGPIKTLISIAYSSSRGLIVAKGAGSIFGTSPIPIIDPSKFIKNEDNFTYLLPQ